MQQPTSSRIILGRLFPLVLLGIFLPSLTHGNDPAAESRSAQETGELRFAFQVEPLLTTRCLACHGNDPKDIKGELDLRNVAGLLKGGESGQAAVIPGKSAQSPLYLAAMRGSDEWSAMPPKENDRLAASELEHLRQWIDAGAPWPGSKRLEKLRQQKNPWRTPGGIQVETSGGLSQQWTDRTYNPLNLWAFQPLKTPAIPGPSGHPVDRFIQHRLPPALTLAPEADPLTLVRRVTFDLTGLPPTPGEVSLFLAASRQDPKQAWIALVDRLLASPHYGEQMARHWLDVVRYADTAGFSNDYPRPNAWRYRDYVVRSFNQDKPYDQFVREQIAGDEIAPDQPDHVIATGFLRMGPWEHTSMTVAAVTRQQYLDDVVNAVGVSFLGTELRCAKCHDHKFDPIPTRDYYRMQAIFSPLQFADRTLPFQQYENQDGMAEGKARYEQLAKTKGIRSILTLPESERPVSEFDAESETKGQAKVARKRSQQLQHELKRFKPLAYSVYNGKNTKTVSHLVVWKLPDIKARQAMQAAPIHILQGGAIESPAAHVNPGVLSFSSGSEAASAVTDQLNGRRRELADWIASADNPLTARVIVNRIWQWHFGQGLAANPNNFGATGQKPTHPQLLDWLATTFIKEGWSFKKMHRRLLLSRTYRRASSHPDPALLSKLDPAGSSYATFQPRRLAAEELRDAMLASSGELNRKLGGIPAHPEINAEVAMQPRHIMGSVGPAYQSDLLPTQRNRRTIYAERIRTLADPLLEVFNKPGPDLSCERRESATIAPQAFTLLNSPIIRARALALAARLEKEKPDNLAAQVQRAFQLVYHRPVTATEQQVCIEHVNKMTGQHEDHLPVKTKMPTHVIRQMVEEMTGLDFWWVEDLDLYRSDQYVPDLKPWDVTARTRALADLCLVLLNSNEFSYVY